MRLTFSPDAAEFQWIPAPETADALPTLEQTLREVDEGLARRAVAETPLEPGERLDPNHATAEQLERLPGIGPARAFAIVEERRRNGPYGEPADLRRVSGIGETLARRLAPYLTLRPNPVAPRQSRSRSSRPPNLNRATREQLLGLPGIGPARADSLIAYRERAGRFSSWQDVAKVPGIGAAVLRGLQGRAVVE